MARGSSISNYEIGMIKALINKGESNQNILGYINHYRGDVTNHINNGRITDVKQGKIGKDIKPASLQEAEEFIKKYKTSYQSDEITNLLLLKIRKAIAYIDRFFLMIKSIDNLNKFYNHERILGA